MRLRRILAVVVVLGGVSLFYSLSASRKHPGNAQAASPTSLEKIMMERNLTPDEAAAALKTFVPPGKMDDFVMVTSGGHGGYVMLYGIPSMRLLKTIPVYS